MSRYRGPRFKKIRRLGTLPGPCRGRMNIFLLSSINNKTYKKDDIWINKIHGLLLSSIQIRN